MAFEFMAGKEKTEKGRGYSPGKGRPAAPRLIGKGWDDDLTLLGKSVFENVSRLQA